jgi:hypothetical protein
MILECSELCTHMHAGNMLLCLLGHNDDLSAAHVFPVHSLTWYVSCGTPGKPPVLLVYCMSCGTG